MSFCSVYIPVGVPTYHLETAQDHFERSCAMLRGVDPDFSGPDRVPESDLCQCRLYGRSAAPL